MISKSLNQATIAELASVSRASVTKWFQEGEGRDWVNVETKTIIQLAEALKISPEYFLKPLSNLDVYETRFLWDHLYPDMGTFLKALQERRLVALARLVQVLGLYAAVQVLGQVILKKFWDYAKYIKPSHRRSLETLWPLYHSQS